MNYIRSFLFLLLLVKGTLSAISQDIKQYEDSINSLYKIIKTPLPDTLKDQTNLKIIDLFNQILSKPESFNYPFDSLNWCGRLLSPDNLFRIFTWNIILNDGTYSYSGIIQYRTSKSNTIQLFNLTDKAPEVQFRENSVLSAGKWYGGLYYKVLKNKVDHITYYTILSLRYNNLFTSSKIIEILYFDEFGNPVFGAPLFFNGKITKLRMVYEYSAKAVMKLNYDESNKMIVFDHLSPSDPRFADQYDYYGPDSSYDGFQFKKNKWVLATNLDIKNPEKSKKNTPKKSPVSNKITR